MKLDSSIIRYLEKEEFRVLTAIEMGMKNHEIVPLQLIENIAKLRRGGVFKIVQGLLKKKLISHVNKQVNGYALTYPGYDVLAIYTLMKRNEIVQIGNMMGTGKESDIYLCTGQNNQPIVLKLARLGRISFRAVKQKRDYLKGRSKHNWLYLSRLSAIKEFTFMQSLYSCGIPTPTPISHNRHAILMSLIPGYPLINVTSIQHPIKVLNSCLDLAVTLASLGLVHCDFNQFNLMVSDEEKLFVIDFPQMVSVNHLNADELFDKDIRCINEFFSKRFGVSCEELPRLKDAKVERQLDLEIKASGYLRENLKEAEIKEMDKIMEAAKEGSEDEGKEQDSGEEEEEDNDDDNDEEEKEDMIGNENQADEQDKELKIEANEKKEHKEQYGAMHEELD